MCIGLEKESKITTIDKNKETSSVAKYFFEKAKFSGEELKKRQYLAGLSIEDLELILHPMAEEGKEASGSMGDDTPVAVLSSHFRPVSHYFRQNFSQVTNCLLYTSPSPRDRQKSRMPSSA